MTRLNDSRLWALMMDPLRSAGLDTPAAGRVSRQLVAVVRNERSPQRRTYGPGDALPDPPPAQVTDLDGDVWEQQPAAGEGCYRMCDRDRARNADSSDDIESIRVWPNLLEEYGPLTADRDSNPPAAG
ncbi:hypothetical protein ACQPXM_41255 (plasmid) [Kribbella sp. CA-253562]|uniref:hypothetical protein n=1 Tax=Kribbella sp. CA-253562 TaxID=3239942 RepID=UPI003D8F2057